MVSNPRPQRFARKCAVEVKKSGPIKIKKLGGEKKKMEEEMKEEKKERPSHPPREEFLAVKTARELIKKRSEEIQKIRERQSKATKFLVALDDIRQELQVNFIKFTFQDGTMIIRDVDEKRFYIQKGNERKEIDVQKDYDLVLHLAKQKVLQVEG